MGIKSGLIDQTRINFKSSRFLFQFIRKKHIWKAHHNHHRQSIAINQEILNRSRFIKDFDESLWCYDGSLEIICKPFMTMLVVMTNLSQCCEVNLQKFFRPLKEFLKWLSKCAHWQICSIRLSKLESQCDAILSHLSTRACPLFSPLSSLHLALQMLETCRSHHDCIHFMFDDKHRHDVKCGLMERKIKKSTEWNFTKIFKKKFKNFFKIVRKWRQVGNDDLLRRFPCEVKF